MGKYEIYLGLLLREGDSQQIRSSLEPIFLKFLFLLFTGSFMCTTAVTSTEFLSYTMSIVQPSGTFYRISIFTL